MTRRRITNLMRVRVFLNHAGRCHICGLRIDTVKEPHWHVDHVKPLEMGGADEENNLAPVHARCHIDKTSAEAPVRAKSNRVRAAHLGIKRPKHKIRGWRKFDGTPVYASDEP